MGIEPKKFNIYFFNHFFAHFLNDAVGLNATAQNKYITDE